jgi:LPXTG-motif cell wall-anchored protein
MQQHNISPPRPRPAWVTTPEPEPAAELDYYDEDDPPRPASHRATEQPRRVDRNVVLIIAGAIIAGLALAAVFLLAITPAHAAGPSASVVEGAPCATFGVVYRAEGSSLRCEHKQGRLCWHKVDYPCPSCTPKPPCRKCSPSPSPSAASPVPSTSASPEPSGTPTPSTSPTITGSPTMSPTVGPSDTGFPPDVPDDELPVTGSPVRGLVLLGVGAVALGVVLLVARRRRRAFA